VPRALDAPPGREASREQKLLGRGWHRRAKRDLRHRTSARRDDGIPASQGVLRGRARRRRIRSLPNQLQARGVWSSTPSSSWSEPRAMDGGCDPPRTLRRRQKQPEAIAARHLGRRRSAM